MRRETHLIFGVGTTLLLFSSSVSAAIEIVPISAIGSLIPDIDTRFRHRALAHSVFALLAFFLITAVAVMLLGLLRESAEALSIAAAGAYAYSTHIFLDSLTVSGVRLLWPINKKSYGLRLITYDNRLANLAFTAIGGLSIFAYLLR